MKKFAISLVLAGVLSSSGFLATSTLSAGVSNLNPSVTITVGETPERAKRLDENLLLFRRNNLVLPNLEVRFFDDESSCKDHPGLFQPQFAPRRVLICSDLPFIIPHELAHAWEAVNLSQTERVAYTARRGFETWNDPAADWNDWAQEDVAFIIQQNLTVGSVRTTSRSWRERMAAYELLTNQPSPLRR